MAAAASVAKFNPPLHACPKTYTPPKERRYHCAPRRRHRPAKDLLINHEKTKQKQNQPPPHPESPMENRTPALDAFAPFLLAGPAPRAELIRAAGHVALSLAVSSWRQISYFGSGGRERSPDHPAAPLCAGQLQGKHGKGGQRDEHLAMLPAPRWPSKGGNVRSRGSRGGDLTQTRAEAFVPNLLKVFYPRWPYILEGWGSWLSPDTLYSLSSH